MPVATAVVESGSEFAAAAPAQADYRSEYKQYADAFNAGDIERALKHGEAAWRDAETELARIDDRPRMSRLSRNPLVLVLIARLLLDENASCFSYRDQMRRLVVE